MYVPLVPLYVAPQEACWSAKDSDDVEGDDACTEVGSSVSTELPQRQGVDDWDLGYAYQRPSVWHFYEHGLYLKTTHLPLLDACFIESDQGDYRPFGTMGDFWRLAENMELDIAVATECGVQILRKNQAVEISALKPGLRYLRCFPQSLGIMAVGGRFAHLEATWRLDDKRIGRSAVQNELVNALLRSRGNNHVSFW